MELLLDNEENSPGAQQMKIGQAVDRALTAPEDEGVPGQGCFCRGMHF